MASRKRPKIGDLVRITAGGRSAIAQYIHRHPEFGYLVRVIGPEADESSGSSIVGSTVTQFVTFFPLGAACSRGIAEIIGTADIPAELREFPRFRQAMRLDPIQHSSSRWAIWDGRDEWIVENLAPEQYSYPLRAIMNDTLLVDRAHAGWTVEQER